MDTSTKLDDFINSDPPVKSVSQPSTVSDGGVEYVTLKRKSTKYYLGWIFLIIGIIFAVGFFIGAAYTSSSTRTVCYVLGGISVALIITGILMLIFCK